MAKLTAKQQRFVDEYLVDLNATQAAIRAGYSPETAEQIGYQLLQKTSVKNTVAVAMAERSRRTGITQDRVLREYARLAFFDPRQLFDSNGEPKDIAGLDEDTAAALAGLEVVTELDGSGDDGAATYTRKYKLANKLGALDSLGKHLGLFERGANAVGQNAIDDFIRATKPTKEELEALYAEDDE